MKQRILTLVLLFLMLFLVLTGCGGTDSNTPDVTDPSDVSDVPQPDPEPVIPMGTNPLTGLPLELEYVNDRPVAVIFNNLYQAMPQLGISQADIIYEIPAEGGITRMLGVFQTLKDVETLGSIRSARPYFLEVALGHDAFFVHAGGSEDAYSNLRKWDVDNMDGVRGGNDAKIFWRDPDRKKSMGSEHSLVTSGEKVQEYIDSTSWTKEHPSDYVYGQTYAEDGTPKDGTPAEYFELYFSHYKTGRFTYDDTSRQYKVVQYSAPYIDGNSGDQVSVTNVLILETDIRRISGDAEGRLTVRTTGSGEGTYFCGGKSIPIQWSKESRNDPFVYTKTDGSPLVLEQGNTYVCIMDPDQSKLTIPEKEEAASN